jgi:hypothetical protein
MDAQAHENRRRSPRAGMLKRAQILAGECVYDCVVLDGSAGGARVQLETPTALPDTVKLRFSGGIAAPAVRRWGNGAQWGLELLEEGRQLNPMQSQQAWTAYEALRDGQLDRAIRLLRQDHFYEDEALREAAANAEAARDKLEAALRQRAQEPSPGGAKPNSW